MKYERFRAACAAMQAIVSNAVMGVEADWVAKNAVEYADALMEQLYGKKKPANPQTGIQSGSASGIGSEDANKSLPRTSPGVAVESKSPGA